MDEKDVSMAGVKGEDPAGLSMSPGLRDSCSGWGRNSFNGNNDGANSRVSDGNVAPNSSKGKGEW